MRIWPIFLILILFATGCADGESPRRSTEAAQLTDQLVSIYESNPQIFYSNEIGREVEVTADVQYIQENGRIELDTGEWVWFNDLECVVNDNFMLAKLNRWDSVRVRGVVHSIEDDGEFASTAHRITLVPCHILEVVN